MLEQHGCKSLERNENETQIGGEDELQAFASGTLNL